MKIAVLVLGVVLMPLTSWGSIPDIWGVWDWQHVDSVQLMVSPGSSSTPLTAARNGAGAVVDATIRIQLWAQGGAVGEPIPAAPVAFFPAEDLWLESSGLSACMGGSTADGNTDAEGWFTFSQPLSMGGWTDPAGGSPAIWVMISGMTLRDQAGATINPGILVNSPDINGDLVVNLSDVVLFTNDFYGSYSFRSDFVWDSVINLSDVVRLATGLGDECP